MTKRYKVNLTQLAQKDLEQIYYYIAADSIKNATNFVLELEKKIYSLLIKKLPHSKFHKSDIRIIAIGVDYAQTNLIYLEIVSCDDYIFSQKKKIITESGKIFKFRKPNFIIRSLE